MGELIIRDGQDGTIGATTDAAVTSDAPGTVIGFARGLVKILAHVWDSGNGRIKVDGSGVTQPVTSVKPSLITGTIEAVNGVVSCELGTATGVTFGTTGYGSYSGATIVFEASHDGDKWYTIMAQRQDFVSTRITYISLSTSDVALFADVNGFRYFRVKASALSSGSIGIWIAPTENMVMAVDVLGVAYPTASPSYGYYTYHFKISLASTNATSVKTSAAQVGSILLSNSHATDWRYAKFYNKASAPTVGTDTPILILAIPPKSHITIHNQAGFRFMTGLAYALTALPAVSDTTAIGADEVIVNLMYV